MSCRFTEALLCALTIPDEQILTIMALSTPDSVKLLADGLALVYHEARHARHLVKAGYLSTAGWERLLSLPTNRVQAWSVIQTVREAAAEAKTASEAAVGFERRFRKSLAELQGLYTNDHWRTKKVFGGHAWYGVTATVIALRDAIELGVVSEIELSAHSLLVARHNNGTLRDKITGLDADIGVRTGQWWH
jgi:hypothetical protein